jgi:hypothetical protein
LAIPNEAQTVVRGFQRENPPLKLSIYEFVLKHEPAAVAINRTAAAQPRLSFFER